MANIAEFVSRLGVLLLQAPIIQGELASVQAGKQRLIEAISLGILTNQEAAGKLAELR